MNVFLVHRECDFDCGQPVKAFGNLADAEAFQKLATARYEEIKAKVLAERDHDKKTELWRGMDIDPEGIGPYGIWVIPVEGRPVKAAEEP